MKSLTYITIWLLNLNWALAGIVSVTDKFSLHKDCYPFLESPKNLVTRSERIDFNGKRATQTVALSGSGHPCEEKGVCWCADTNDPDESIHALPVLCQMASVPQNNEFSTCQLNPGNQKFVQYISGCNGKCYRIPDHSNTLDIAVTMINKFAGDNTVNKGMLRTINNNGQGICLPTFECIPQKVGRNIP